jgi:hypothetical protein
MVGPLTADAYSRQVQGSREREVESAENRRFEAMLRSDVEALGRLLADDLIYTHSNGIVDTKARYLESLKSGDLKYISIEREDVKLRVYGNTAVITGRGLFKARSRGQELNSRLRFTDVWVRNRGAWRMVAWQSTRIQE